MVFIQLGTIARPPFPPTVSDFQPVDFNKIKIIILTWQENYVPQYFSKATKFLRSFLHSSDVLCIDLSLTFFHENSLKIEGKKKKKIQKTRQTKEKESLPCQWSAWAGYYDLIFPYLNVEPWCLWLCWCSVCNFWWPGSWHAMPPQVRTAPVSTWAPEEKSFQLQS